MGGSEITRLGHSGDTLNRRPNIADLAGLAAILTMNSGCQNELLVRQRVVGVDTVGDVIDRRVTGEC